LLKIDEPASIVCEVIEHRYSPDDFIEGMAKVLGSGGLIIVTAPSWMAQQPGNQSGKRLDAGVYGDHGRLCCADLRGLFNSAWR